MKHYKHLSKAEKVPFWQSHIQKWKNSGLKLNEYCSSNQLNNRTFQYWYYRLKKETKNETRLVPVQFKSIEDQTDNFTPLELIINHSITLKIKCNFDPDHLIKVLHALGVDL